MAEEILTTIIPGTYIRVRSEGLIRAGGFAVGNIGIVGTARIQAVDEAGDPQTAEDGSPIFDSSIYGRTFVLSDYASARAQLGNYDALLNASGAVTGQLNLVRALQVAYQNGARTVFARALSPTPAPNQAAYTAAFNELIKDDVNILIAPELAPNVAAAVLNPLLVSAENSGKDMIAIVGSNVDTAALNTFLGSVPSNDTGRIILATPGIYSFDTAAGTNGEVVAMPGQYTAAAVAGLISGLAVQSSPTNKVLPGVTQLTQRFSYGELEQLVSGNVLALEERRGVRVVRGVTTNTGAFTQITTRRIVDAAKRGIRLSADPFIGKLNNQRVRKALYGAIASFLDTLVSDEALVSYTLEVTASRDDEIAGRAVVNAVLLPTFSIDYILVTLNLQ
ncbi:MAG: phage tail sheath subtilisin-like domain-containing protein [Nodosilinea sp.]